MPASTTYRNNNPRRSPEEKARQRSLGYDRRRRIRRQDLAVAHVAAEECDMLVEQVDRHTYEYEERPLPLAHGGEQATTADYVLQELREDAKRREKLARKFGVPVERVNEALKAAAAA